MKFKLKYKDGATKKLCMLRASVQRKQFSKLMWSGQFPTYFRDKKVDFDLISFSGKNELEEQALSIYSFVFYVGLPKQWVIYSDGSHSEKEKDCLVRLFPFVVFKNWNYNSNLSGNVLLQNYLKICHLSKKLHAILGHDYTTQTIYVDSDVLFYKDASAYFHSDILKNHFWFIPETNWGALNNTVLNTPSDMFVLNSGLLVLNKSFQFDDVFTYLQSLDSNYTYFSEQSAFNYSFKKQNAGILDPRKFIVDTEDQFDFSMRFGTNEMAVRHYVNPVRHKMWQKGWEWHFKG